MNKPDTKNKAEISVDDQVAKIFTWRRGFNAVFLIDIGVELGLFKALAEKPGRTAAQIAADLKLHPPYVEVWCMTAFGLGLLDADEQRHFTLAPYMDKILASPGHPRDLTGYIRLGTAFLTEDFERCRKAFHSGETVPFQGRSHAFADTIGDAIGGLHAATARKLLPDLAGMTERLENGAKVLEVGCGTGRFLMQLAKAWPKAHCTGADIDPTGIEIAIPEPGVRERGDSHPAHESARGTVDHHVVQLERAAQRVPAAHSGSEAPQAQAAGLVVEDTRAREDGPA